MSLILDALRKMEQERRSRRGAAQDLRPEVLRYRLAAQPKEPRRFPLAVLGGAVLLCAGLGAGFLLKGTDPQPGAVTSAAAPVQTQAAPVSQGPPAPQAAPAPVAVVAPQVPVQGAPAAASPVAAAQPPVAVAQPVPPPAEQPRKRLWTPASAQPPAQSDAASRTAPPVEAVAVSSGPDIVISGIAYQDERRLRRAVLNGALVGEGAEIAGARVVEIKESKVRLSRGGQIFEVPFSSGLQSR